MKSLLEYDIKISNGLKKGVQNMTLEEREQFGKLICDSLKLFEVQTVNILNSVASKIISVPQL